MDYCLENIIALTRNNCECFGEIPIVESTSGIYLDEIAGGGLLNQLFCANSCGIDFYTKAQRFINNAIQQTINDLFSSIYAEYETTKGLLKKTTIGELKSEFSLAKPKKYKGIQICYNDFKSGQFCIYKIGLAPFQNEVTKVIKIYDHDFNLLHTQEITAHNLGVKWLTLNEPIKIKMEGRNCLRSIYIVYENCPVKSRRIYNWCKGCKGNAPKWSESIIVRPYNNDSLQSTDCSIQCIDGNIDINGILLQASLECDKSDMLCCMLENDCFKMAFAQTAANKAIEFLLTDISSRNLFNYTTIANAKFWNKMIVNLKGNYVSSIFGDASVGLNPLIELIDFSDIDCLCKKQTGGRFKWRF